MNGFVIVALASAAIAWAQPVEVAKQCLNNFCAELSLDKGLVRFKESANFVPSYIVGQYVSVAHPWVPAEEAPIRMASSNDGWKVIATACLQEYDAYGPTIRVRVFDPDGKLREMYDGKYHLDRLEVGDLFGGRSGTNTILAIETSGAHSYEVQAVIWVLSDKSKPKRLLEIAGVLDRFQTGVPKRGVWIKRETYDGINGSTKGRRAEFWSWNEQDRTLAIEATHR